MLPLSEAASLHLSEVTTALPLLEAAGLHLYSLARLMLFAFFVSKGSLFLCELHKHYSFTQHLASETGNNALHIWAPFYSFRFFEARHSPSVSLLGPREGMNTSASFFPF